MNKKPNAKVKAKKKKLKSIARLVDDAAVLLQKLVRMKAADSQGIATCCTCGKRYHWKELQGGHFIQRNRIATKLTEENVNPQCEYCNHRAMKTTVGVLEYEAFMIAMYGGVFVQKLVAESRAVKKYTRQEVEDISADFVARIKEQEERLGL